ncbi:MAG: hypothetical protein AAGF66_08225 [Cyanobacteria bacterium P01_H01_bin.119]
MIKIGSLLLQTCAHISCWTLPIINLGLLSEPTSAKTSVVSDYPAEVSYAQVTSDNPDPFIIDGFSKSLIQRALSSTRQIDNLQDKVELLSSIAKLYTRAEQFDTATYLWEEALDNTQNISDIDVRISLMSEIAGAYSLFLGNTAKAEEILGQALSLLESILIQEGDDFQSDHSQLSLANQIAFRYALMGQNSQAIDVLNRLNYLQNLYTHQNFILNISVRRAVENNNHNLARQLILESNATPFSTYNSFAPELVNDRIILEQFTNLYNLARNYHSTNQIIQFDLTIADQESLINQYSTILQKANGYTALAQQLIEFEQPERATSFLEKALQEVAKSDLDRFCNCQRPSYRANLAAVNIGSLLIQAGHLERGMALIQAIINEPDLIKHKISMLLSVVTAINSSSYSQAESEVTLLLAEIEDLITLMDEPRHQRRALMDVASAYVEVGNHKRAQDIAQTLRESNRDLNIPRFNIAQSSEEAELIYRWTYLLEQLGEYEQALRFAIVLEDDEVIQHMLLSLNLLQHEHQIQSALNAINSPAFKSEALAAIAGEYLSLGQPEAAFEAMLQALEILQSSEPLYEEDYEDNEYRRELIAILIEAYAEVAEISQIQALIQSLEDIETRIEARLAISDRSAELLELLLSVTDLELRDEYLSRLAIDIAFEGQFQRSLDIAEFIASPTKQAQILIFIASESLN